jgi:hypothetical protein
MKAQATLVKAVSTVDQEALFRTGSVAISR